MTTPTTPMTQKLYSVESHGDGWAIYKGRDSQHHGLNLGHLTECGSDVAAMLESALNAAQRCAKLEAKLAELEVAQPTSAAESAISVTVYKLAEKELERLVDENFGRMPQGEWADQVLNLRDAHEAVTVNCPQPTSAVVQEPVMTIGIDESEKCRSLPFGMKLYDHPPSKAEPTALPSAVIRANLSIEPNALGEIISQLVLAAKMTANSSAPSGTLIHNQPVRLLMEVTRQNLLAAAEDAEKAMRQYTDAYWAAAATPPPVAGDAALQAFTEYFVKNYPGPDTIIHDPRWHAPKIFKAAIDAAIAAGGGK